VQSWSVATAERPLPIESLTYGIAQNEGRGDFRGGDKSRPKQNCSPLADATLFIGLPMPKRILIAEDETSVRNAIRTFLENRCQFEVCEAVDGDEAIKKADALKPDLVVLDLRMPIANGIEVAARLHVSMPKTPVVIFTMFEDVLGRPLAKILGIAAVVPKSDGVGKLLGRIEALLEAEDALARQGH
jgi:CheY-like chemotaxis protein